jgi:hypothetical protein
VRYLLLLTNTEERIAEWEGLDAEGRGELMDEAIPKWNAFFERVAPNPLSGLQLELPRTARTIRDGGLVTDGPYAETKEQVGGYLLVDCESLDEAIEVASHVPVAATGSVEIRPLDE